MSNSPSLEPEALLAQAGWIRALARSLVRGDEVDDLVQDTWHAALQRPPRVHSESGLRAWLGRVARNLAIDRRRAGAARAERSTRAHREPPERPDEAFERVVLQRRLVDAVLALDEPYRSAVIWRYFDGLDPRAIAERQGVSHDAARQRIARALARLRSRLDREYDGGRAQWVAFAGSLFEHAAPAPWITGGALMGAKWMGVAAIAVIGLASWWWWRTESAELAGERTNVVASAKLDSTFGNASKSPRNAPTSAASS
ncbi:MAG: sigma-70 family RNA polymerase sigma factor [Planctomycetes bacterium]|nr:sigma-70 family RNA polymerase sigma factor [Planctomycetota bacterium]